MTFLVAAGIGAGGALLGGLISSRGASKAAGTQAAAQDQATELQGRMYDETVIRNQPYIQAGNLAQNRLLSLLGLQPDPAYGGGLTASQNQNALNYTGTDPNFGKYGRDPTMADLEIDPGYQFRLDEGLKALDRTASARGGLLSGGALKAASRYGQNLGSQEYQNAYNRYQTNRSNQLNPLGSLMSSGQNAANNTGSAAQNYANQAGAGMIGAGQAVAAGQMGAANSINNALNSMGSTYQNATLMNQLFKPGTTPALNYSWYDG